MYRNRSSIEMFDQMLAMGQYYASGRPVYVKPTIIVEDVLTKLPVGRNDLVLDVGCGTGVVTSVLAEHCRAIVALDAGAQVVDAGREAARARGVRNVTYCLGSALDLPFQQDLFDHVLMYAVIHYLEDEAQVRQCVAELVRVCKPGGRILIAEVPDERARREFDRRPKTPEEQSILEQFNTNRREYDRLFTTHVCAPAVPTSLVLDCDKIVAEGLSLGCEGRVWLQDIRQPFSLTRRDILLAK